MKLKILIFAFTLFVLPSKGYHQGDVIDEIVSLLKSSNITAFSKLFAPTVETDILSVEKTCTKTEAEQLINKFFSKYPISSVTLIHRINSKPDYKLAVVSMQSSGGKFRITISVKNSGNGFLISEIRIEKDPSS